MPSPDEVDTGVNLATLKNLTREDLQAHLRSLAAEAIDTTPKSAAMPLTGRQAERLKAEQEAGRARVAAIKEQLRVRPAQVKSKKELDAEGKTVAVLVPGNKVPGMFSKDPAAGGGNKNL